MRLVLLAVALASIAMALTPITSASSQACRINLAAQPPVVEFPGTGFPAQGSPTFYEIVNVNYSTALVNQTIYLQYFNGTTWRGLYTFVGNRVGFTEADVGVDSSWARFGSNSVRAVAGACASDVVSFSVQTDTLAVPVAVVSYILAGLFLVGFYFFGRKLGNKGLVLVAAAFYLAVSPFTGQRYDIYFLASSGIRILQHVNPFDPGNPAVFPGALKWAYPPLYALYSALSFVGYQLLTGAPLPSVSALTYQGWLTSAYSVWQAYVPSSLPVLVLLLKIPMIASAVLTGVLLVKMTGDSSALVKWVANPLVVLVAAVWGQLDPIATLLALVSIHMFQRGKRYHAYAFAALGAAVKVWPVLLIPLFFVVSARKDGSRSLKPLLAVLPAIGVTLAIYGIYGNVVQSLFVFAYARGIPTYAGQFSVNGLTWQQILFVTKTPPLPIFLVVGVPAYVAVLVWMYWKRADDVVKWLTVSILIFFLTYNYVNPQYFYWIVPLMMLRGKKLATIAFTALPLVYVALSYNLFYFISPSLLPDEFAFGASIADQLKVNFFYGTPVLLVLVAGLIPTAIYLAQLFAERQPKRVSQEGVQVTGS